MIEEERRRFVLGQYEMYGVLAQSVVDMRKALKRGDDLADVLIAEVDRVLASEMTREQIATALVSVMALAAQGVDVCAEHERLVLAALAGMGLPADSEAGRIRAWLK